MHLPTHTITHKFKDLSKPLEVQIYNGNSEVNRDLNYFIGSDYTESLVVFSEKDLSILLANLLKESPNRVIQTIKIDSIFLVSLGNFLTLNLSADTLNHVKTTAIVLGCNNDDISIISLLPIYRRICKTFSLDNLMVKFVKNPYQFNDELIYALDSIERLENYQKSVLDLRNKLIKTILTCYPIFKNLL